MISAPETIATQRLHLRKPRPEDAQLIFDGYAHDPQVAHYVSWLPHEDAAESLRIVERFLAHWESGKEFVWLAIQPEHNHLVGVVGISIDGHGGQLGYCLGRPHWGQGYATELADAVAKWALSLDEVHRVWAVCDVDNTASARVLEKLGMIREGTLRRWCIHPNVSPWPRDCFCYSLIHPGSAAPLDYQV